MQTVDKSINEFKPANPKPVLPLIMTGGAIALAALSQSGAAMAQASGATSGAPADVTTGIDSAKATVNALSGLALVALTVSLTPMGAMLTLRFLNMVLSRV